MKRRRRLAPHLAEGVLKVVGHQLWALKEGEEQVEQMDGPDLAQKLWEEGVSEEPIALLRHTPVGCELRVLPEVFERIT